MAAGAAARGQGRRRGGASDRETAVLGRGSEGFGRGGQSEEIRFGSGERERVRFDLICNLRFFEGTCPCFLGLFLKAKQPCLSGRREYYLLWSVVSEKENIAGRC
jgi:hypothetical protein